MKNELTEVQMELDGLRANSDKTKFDFYDSLQLINEANAPQSIGVNCLLAEYTAAEKSAIKKTDAAKQRALTKK